MSEINSQLPHLDPMNPMLPAETILRQMKFCKHPVPIAIVARNRELVAAGRSLILYSMNLIIFPTMLTVLPDMLNRSSHVRV